MNRYSHIHAICQDGSITWTLRKEEGGFMWSTRVTHDKALPTTITPDELVSLTKQRFSLSTEEVKLVKVTIVETKK